MDESEVVEEEVAWGTVSKPDSDREYICLCHLPLCFVQTGGAPQDEYVARGSRKVRASVLLMTGAQREYRCA